MSNWLRNRSMFHASQKKTVVVETKTERPFRPLHILSVLLQKLCVLVGACVLIGIVLGSWSVSHLTEVEAPKLPKQIVLFLRMEKSFPDKRGAQDYFSQFGLAPAPLTASDVVDALDKGAHDSRVKGFVLSLRSGGYEIAQLQELRAAVLRFKASGKFTKVYAPSYGEAGSGLGMYYLASAFDEIWMQPVGNVSIVGISAQSPYFKNVLDKVGIKAEFFQRKEYKNAMENLTATQMSPASREMMQALIGDLGDQLTTGIAQGRPKVAGTIKSLIDRGLFTDDEALKYGLIDRLDYGDVLMSEIGVKLAGPDYAKKDDTKKDEAKKFGFVDIDDYYDGEAKPKAGKPKVAVILVQGVISEDGGASPLTLEEKSVNASEIAQAIHDAGEDKDVHTIVVRLNSPGGSPSASETIRRAIVWAKETRHKTVIVSMGALAASGGYWISADADQIYADAGTLTGSIGVLGGKFDASEFFKKYDVTWDGVSYGANAGMFDMNKGFTAAGQERFEASLDNIYAHFVKIVSEGRHMKPDQVEQIARGRVWSGRQAQKLGLVDKIGGFDMVMDDIAKNRGLSDRHKLAVVELPEPENPLQQVVDMIQKKSLFGASLPPILEKFAVYLPFLSNQQLVYVPLPKI